jgi:hypothetical protein
MIVSLRPDCRWLARQALETRVADALRALPDYRDVSAVDIEDAPRGPAGQWRVVLIWRGHVVEQPCGSTWDASGRAAVDALGGLYRLAPRTKAIAG